MASSSIPTSTPSFRNEGFIDSTLTGKKYLEKYQFEDFMDSIQEYLDNDQFENLERYFHENHSKFKTTLEAKQSLKPLLDKYIRNPDSIFKATTLLNLIRHNLQFTKAHKIQEILCYFLLGNEELGTAMIFDMIDADQKPSLQSNYYQEMGLLKASYHGDARLTDVINYMQQLYRAFTASSEGSSSPSSSSSSSLPHVGFYV